MVPYDISVQQVQASSPNGNLGNFMYEVDKKSKLLWYHAPKSDRKNMGYGAAISMESFLKEGYSLQKPAVEKQLIVKV